MRKMLAMRHTHKIVSTLLAFDISIIQRECLGGSNCKMLIDELRDEHLASIEHLAWGRDASTATGKVLADVSSMRKVLVRNEPDEHLDWANRRADECVSIARGRSNVLIDACIKRLAAHRRALTAIADRRGVRCALEASAGLLRLAPLLQRPVDGRRVRYAKERKVNEGEKRPASPLVSTTDVRPRAPARDRSALRRRHRRARHSTATHAQSLHGRSGIASRRVMRCATHRRDDASPAVTDVTAALQKLGRCTSMQGGCGHER